MPSVQAAQFIRSEIQRAQDLGEEARDALAMRALEDVAKVRNLVVRLLQLSEDRAQEVPRATPPEPTSQLTLTAYRTR